MYGAECKTFFPQGSRKNCKNYYDSMYTKLRTRREHPHYLWKRQSPRKNILGSFMWPKMVEPNTKCIPLQQLFFLIKLTVTSCFSWLINKNETFFFFITLELKCLGSPWISTQVFGVFFDLQRFSFMGYQVGQQFSTLLWE